MYIIIWPGDLTARIADFVNYYNTERYHESLNNPTPEDVYISLAMKPIQVSV